MFDGPPEALTPAKVEAIYGVSEDEFDDGALAVPA
jgi:hypothetical protein